MEWARLNPEQISQFLDRLAAEPKLQISLCKIYDSLCLLFLRLYNKEKRTLELMELQLKHRVELLLEEERICLEQHEKDLAVRRSRVFYLGSVKVEPEFAECTQWRSKLPSLPKWPSRRKANKKRSRASSRDGPTPKRKCSMRSKVGNIFTSGTTASLFREAFPNQKGVVVSKTEPVAENLFDMSLDKILSDVEWEPTIVELLTPVVSLVVGDPGKDLEREDPVEPVPEVSFI